MKKRKFTGRRMKHLVKAPEVFVDITEVKDITLENGIKVIKRHGRIAVGISTKQQRDLAERLESKGYKLVPASNTDDIVVYINPNEYIRVRRANWGRYPVRQSFPKIYVAKGGSVLPKPEDEEEEGKANGEQQGGK